MMKALEPLNGKKVLITGGTGFVGGRLLKLLADAGARISVVIRNYGRAMSLARYPIRIIHADLCDKEVLRDEFQGMDFVFHCAYGTGHTAEERARIDIDATNNLLELSLEQGVESFLFLSTQMVYGIPDTPELNEESPREPSGDEYGVNKKAAEDLVLEYSKKGLNTVILQPTAVYGPGSPSYGKKIFEKMFRSRLPLIDGGEGILNLVFVDDLVQAMCKAINNPASYGKFYLINGPEPIKWADFYRSMEQVVGEESTFQITSEEALRMGGKTNHSFFRVLFRSLTLNRGAMKQLAEYPVFRQLFKIAGFFVPVGLRRKMYRIGNPPGTEIVKTKIVPDKDTIQFQKMEVVVSSESAKNTFGYMPEFDFKKGMSEVRNWYIWYYHHRA